MMIVPAGDKIELGDIAKIEPNDYDMLVQRLQIRGAGSLEKYGYYLPNFNEHYEWEVVLDDLGKQTLIYRRKETQ